MEPHEDTLFDDTAPAGKDALADIHFEMTAAGKWLLKVIGGPNNGAEFAMQAGHSYTIGTDPNTCDIVFHDTSVSRQHAKITVGSDDALSIEDLKSRNGTLVDGESLKEKKALTPNALVNIGTTSFVVYDREGEMQTIVSPLLPSLIKVTKKDHEQQHVERPPEQAPVNAIEKEVQPPSAGPTPPKKEDPEKSYRFVTVLIVLGLLTGMVSIVGMGISSLFRPAPIAVEEQIDVDKVLGEALSPFPSIKWSFNKATGRLQLIGHVLKAGDKNQLLYALGGMRFIKATDDHGIIIDEYVWQEINQLLATNSNWKGILIQATSPGRFVLTGYLQTRKQLEDLTQYLSENFHYLDLLEKKVVVDEDIVNRVSAILQNSGINNLSVALSSGDLSISGNVMAAKGAAFTQALTEIKSVPGVHIVKNFVTVLAPEASLINISDKYTVSGHSYFGKTLTVVINGKILSAGDQLDGMTITEIKTNTILLEKDGVKYQINYSK